MINCTNSASPLSIIHEDTKLILGSLHKSNRNPKKEKVILPLVVTENGVSTDERNSEKATFVGLMFLDRNDNFYFVKELKNDCSDIKVALPILVNHKLLLNKTEETILKLLEENLKFFTTLSDFHLTYLISGFANSGLKNEFFIKQYLERFGRNYVLETLQNDLELSVDVLEDRFEIETDFAKKFFSDEELFDSFIKKIDGCSQCDSSVFTPNEFPLPFKSNYSLLLSMFKSMSYEYQVKTLKALTGKVYIFKSPQRFAILVSMLWNWISLTNHEKLIKEKDLILLASEVAVALIASDKYDLHRNNNIHIKTIEKLFSYIFFEPGHQDFKEIFLEQLEKWFAHKERVVYIRNKIIGTLLLRKDLELNLDKKLVELLNNNKMNVLNNLFINFEVYQKDEIWGSIYYNMLGIEVSELVGEIVPLCQCKIEED